MLVPTGNTVRERSALLMQQDLTAIGVKVQLTTVDFPTLMTQGQLPNGPDLSLVGVVGAADPDNASGLFNPHAGMNFSALRPDQDEIYQMFLQARAGVSFAQRKPIYDAIQKKHLEEAQRLYLYVPNVLVAYNSRVSNIDIASFANMNWDSWNWVIK
jgi:peptide/nickel transport system substrate-binding protein